MLQGGMVGGGRSQGLRLLVLALAAFIGHPAVADDSKDALREDPVCDAARNVTPVSLSDAIVQALQNEPHVIVARAELAESKADATVAVAPFLPKAQLVIDEERLLPNNAYQPVTVVGTNVLGGSKSYSAYGAITVSWNILSSGRDVAGYRAAKEDVYASAGALHSQFADTLSNLLKSYADVYEVSVALDQQGQSLVLLKAIARRAEERYQHGDGTTIAIGQARGAALDAEKSFNETCRSLTEKSSALAKAIGMQLPAGKIFQATERLPDAPANAVVAADVESAVDSDPAVESARRKVLAAQERVHQTRAAFGPQISLDARRDYLGQDVSSFSAANNTISPNSYRIDVSLVQPIFPFLAEIGAVSKAKAEVRRAEALTAEARNDADSKLRMAVSANEEAGSSYRAARASMEEAQKVLMLTESLYKAGRTNLDEFEHAQIDLQKSLAEVETLESEKTRTAWDVERALQAAIFPTQLMRRVGVELADQYLQDGT
jgi:outer membrane protein TolC